MSLCSPEWATITPERLLLVSLSLIFACYSGLEIDNEYSRLINVMARTEFAVCTVIMFLQDPRKCLTHASKSDSRLDPDVSFSVTTSASVIILEDTIFIGLIVDGPTYNMTTWVMDWMVKKRVIGLAESIFPGCSLFFPLKGLSRPVRVDKDVLAPQNLLSKVLFCSFHRHVMVF